VCPSTRLCDGLKALYLRAKGKIDISVFKAFSLSLPPESFDGAGEKGTLQETVKLNKRTITFTSLERCYSLNDEGQNMNKNVYKIQIIATSLITAAI
jgi:hypothetical protein